MASRRSAHFDANVDPDLLALAEAVAAEYAPYDVRFNSGRAGRPTRPGSEHPKGRAIDFSLIDRATNVDLPNIRDPKTAQAYQAYANAVYNAASPEMKKRLRWGGYFVQGVPSDWMHLDVGGAERQAAGNWETGFLPWKMKELGLTEAGGVGGGSSAPTAGYASPETAAAMQPQPVTHPPNPTVGVGDTPGTSFPAAPDAPAKKEKPWWARIGEGLGDAKLGGFTPGQAGAIPQQPGAAVAQVGTGMPINPQQAEMQRQQMAQALARLNTGQLWGM